MRWQILSLWVLFPLLAHGTVYKWVDKQGVTHYSDEPHPGAVPLQPAENTTNQVSMPPVTATGQASTTATATESQASYQLTIISPQHEQTLRDNAGDFDVTAEVTPDLASGHYLQLYLDGIARTDAQSSPLFQLRDIDRGQHSLQLKVVQQNGKVLASSQEITIFLHQAGLIKPVLAAPSAKKNN